MRNAPARGNNSMLYQARGTLSVLKDEILDQVVLHESD
jgi:hypothetical protein